MPIKSFKKHSLTENFQKHLTESLSPKAILQAGNPIRSFLTKKTEYTFFVYPQLERFKNSAGSGYGLRLFSSSGGVSVRFNFSSAGGDLYKVSSFTIWFGSKGYHTDFTEDLSFVKILPIVVNSVNKKSVSNIVYSTPDDIKLSDILSQDLGEDISLTEAADGPEMVADIINMLAQPNFSKSKVYTKYRSPGYKVINTLEIEYPEWIQQKGNKFAFVGSDDDLQTLQNDIPNIMSKLGIVKGQTSRVSASEETYAASDAVKEIENNIPRLTFQEQLKDMRRLLKLTVAGVSNACFIAGRGGVGKTYTTKQILAEGGLTDGDGYFLNKGKITAPALYASLFEHRDGIVVFDDADAVFGDQTSRNILKGATDTDKTRKLNWNISSSNLVDPDEYDNLDDIIEEGKLPKWFNFTGKIIFISNLKMDQIDPDGALRTRGFMISIDPTDAEVYDFMEKIAPNMELEEGLFLTKESRLHVVKLLREGTSKQTANLRKLERGLNMYAGAQIAGLTDMSESELERMISTYA